MHPESGFQIAPNWPEIKKMTITSQFADMTSSSSLRPSEFFPISTEWGGGYKLTSPPPHHPPRFRVVFPFWYLFPARIIRSIYGSSNWICYCTWEVLLRNDFRTMLLCCALKWKNVIFIYFLKKYYLFVF